MVYCDTGIRIKSCKTAGHMIRAYLFSGRMMYCWLLKRMTLTL